MRNLVFGEMVAEGGFGGGGGGGPPHRPRLKLVAAVCLQLVVWNVQRISGSSYGKQGADFLLGQILLILVV